MALFVLVVTMLAKFLFEQTEHSFVLKISYTEGSIGFLGCERLSDVRNWDWQRDYL